MKRFLLHPPKAVFLGVLLFMVVANHAFLFVTPWHENGDFAVNALQIERARHFNEVYGNYSRYHFNHPGPAFFYVYAAGEFLFFDWLQIVPSQHNAHALAGLILQTAFFAAALVIAAGWIRYRWLLPLALLLAGVHFALAGNAFTSIWPPHALLMPFLCFLVAGASTAAGKARHLPLTVLCGCFLVHGHVAQALFVVMIFLLAYGLFVRGRRTPGDSWTAPLRRDRMPHVLGFACIGLFLLPLLVDLAAGADSNLVGILQFLRAGDEAPKSLAQSLAYLASFFSYVHQQDNFIPVQGPVDLGFILARAAWYPAWLAVVGLVGFTLWRLKSQDDAQPERRFLTALAVLVAAGFALTIPWGIIQTGPMFEFNGHFYYALIYALLLLFAAAVARLLPERGIPVLGPVLCAVGAVVFWQSPRQPESTIDASYSWVAATRAALEADPDPGATKFLVFSHDDWGGVAKTALALKRMGGSYRVDGNWSFMFGRYRTYEPIPPYFNLQGMSVWRFSRQALPGRHASLTNDFSVYFDPSPIDPDHFVIECNRGGNLEQFTLFGFNTSDGAFSWTNLPYAALQFSSPPAARDVVFTIEAAPFIARDRIKSQPMELTVNGHKVDSFDLDRPQTLTTRIPARIWNLQPVVTLVFSLPKADSPLRLGMSPDPRKLGWAVSRMTFELAAP